MLQLSSTPSQAQGPPLAPFISVLFLATTHTFAWSLPPMSPFLDPQKLFTERATVFPVLHFIRAPKTSLNILFTYIHFEETNSKTSNPSTSAWEL